MTDGNELSELSNYVWCVQFGLCLDFPSRPAKPGKQMIVRRVIPEETDKGRIVEDERKQWVVDERALAKKLGIWKIQSNTVS